MRNDEDICKIQEMCSKIVDKALIYNDEESERSGNESRKRIGEVSDDGLSTLQLLS